MATVTKLQPKTDTRATQTPRETPGDRDMLFWAVLFGGQGISWFFIGIAVGYAVWG